MFGTEDVDLFDEHPDFIRSEGDWLVIRVTELI